MATKKPYRILRKDGNIGVEASARSLKKAYEYAAQGMCSYLWDPKTVRERNEISLEIRSHDATSLFHKYLQAILHMHQTQKLLVSKVKVPELEDRSVKAVLKGEFFDSRKHEILEEVKAIRQHDIEIKKRAKDWIVRFYFDLDD